jgi:hypothetical protein
MGAAGILLQSEFSNCQQLVEPFLISTWSMSSLKQPKAASESSLDCPFGCNAMLPAKSARSCEMGLWVMGSMPSSHSFFFNRVFQ